MARASDSNSPLNRDRPTLPLDWSYEETVARVEEMIIQIESGDLELADVFDQFAIAIRHLQNCETFLAHHRQQIDLLIETLEDDPSQAS